MKRENLTLEEALPLVRKGRKVMIRRMTNIVSQLTTSNGRVFVGGGSDVSTDGYYIEYDPVEDAIDEVEDYLSGLCEEAVYSSLEKIRTSYRAQKEKK